MHSLKDLDPAIRIRCRIENRIVRQVIKDALAAGYELRVFDGEAESKPSRNPKYLCSYLHETDDDFLNFSLPGNDLIIGWVHFVYGNDGWDVISDHTMNLENVLRGASELAERLEAQ